ncbi:hypothetical protein RF11_03780 [Thelohanellus kitauei]|uniref:Uncharacterized protein n=1 Tax=Thelohanellus kitauei TaxID=669202 RepID=A0A0C2JHU0_THEKT|nr:hypothetical protein RF11_03780 [Thelohanellus kitauei]
MTDSIESVSTKRSTENELFTQHQQSDSINVIDTSPTEIHVKYTTTPMITHPEISTLQTTSTDQADGKTSINSISSNISTSGYVQTETVENAQEQTSTFQGLTQASKVVTTTISTTLVSEESTNKLDIQTQSSTMEYKNTLGHETTQIFSTKSDKLNHPKEIIEQSILVF